MHRTSGGTQGKLRPSWDVYNRIKWDSAFDEGRFTIAYEDRFHGVMAVPFSSFSPSEREKTTGIPWHRVLYFKNGGGVIVWDKEKRVDAVFGDGSGGGDGNDGDEGGHRLSKKEKKKLARQRKREKEASRVDEEDRAFEKAQFEAFVAGTRGQLPLREWASMPHFAFDFETAAWVPCKDGVGEEQRPRLLECSEDTSKITLVTFNALSLRSLPGDDPTARAHALFGLILSSGADLIALQEVTEHTLALLLAEEWVRKGYFVSDCEQGGTLSERGGQVILSRFPLYDVKVYRHSAVRQTVLGQVLIRDRHRRKTLLNVLAVHILGEHILGRRKVDLNIQRAKQLAAVYEFACTEAMMDPSVLVGDFGFDDREAGADALLHPSLVDAWPALHPTEAKGDNRSFDAPASGVTLDPESNDLAALTFADYTPGRVDRVMLRNHPKGGHLWKFCSARLIDPHTPAGCASDHSGLFVTLSLDDASPADDRKQDQSDLPAVGAGTVTRKLVITVGPQCAGKSTHLRELRCYDIAIDDYPELYVPVPLETLPPDHQAILLRDAVYTDSLDPDSLVNALDRTIHKKAFSPKNRQILLDATLSAVLKVRKDGPIVESFRASPTYEKLEHSMFKKAIPGTLRRLEDALKADTPVVAWGNTNSKLSDMHTAVTLAEKYGYAVDFLVLPEVKLDELLRRNICRFLQAGKYVPVEVIFRTKRSVHVMLSTPLTIQRVKKEGRRR